MLTKHIQEADLIITTAAIPGRPSPKLISKAQVAGMKAGAVIVDLSAEGGGNCEDTRPGETAEVGQVTIVAPLNVPSLLGEDASELYAKNQYNLLALMMKDNIITIDWDDEVLAKTVLTHAGAAEERGRPSRPSIRRRRQGSGGQASRQKWPEPKTGDRHGLPISITGFVALYIFMLAAFAGWVIIGHVPAILHTPLMSGSNFVHGIVVVGGHVRPAQREHRAGAGDRVLRRAARRRQRRRRLCRHRSHARDVPDQRSDAQDSFTLTPGPITRRRAEEPRCSP